RVDLREKPSLNHRCFGWVPLKLLSNHREGPSRVAVAGWRSVNQWNPNCHYLKAVRIEVENSAGGLSNSWHDQRAKLPGRFLELLLQPEAAPSLGWGIQEQSVVDRSRMEVNGRPVDSQARILEARAG